MGRPLIHLLVWMRVPGDTLFAIGALLFGWFVLRLWIAPRKHALAARSVPQPARGG
jgi:nitric oxide reductase subunit B